MIYIHDKDGSQKRVPLQDLAKITGISYRPKLEFKDLSTLRRVGKRIKRSKMDLEHQWLSAYFGKEILEGQEIDGLILRWTGDQVGWGVFTEKDLRPQEFIAEYTGIVRKRRGQDSKNGYCFEYPLQIGQDSPYLIDAQDVGGISRYINHSNKPNVTSLCVLVEGFHHIVLYTLAKIGKGEQLCYDYGPSYWRQRPGPIF